MVQLVDTVIAARNGNSFTSTLTLHTTSYAAIDPSIPALSAKGKIILVTGGGQGIGLSVALAFAKANASHIILLGRTLSTLESGKSSITLTNPEVKVHTFVADVVDEAAIGEVFARVHEDI